MNKRENEKRFRVNEQIRFSPVVVIKDEENLGQMDVREALRLARKEGLDLVEVSAQSRPPVCRIMDYGKFKYDQKMKEKAKRSHSKVCDTKEIRLRPITDDHDLKIKAKQAQRFLEDGHNVLFRLRYKKREIAHKELGFQIMEKVLAEIGELCKIKNPPTMNGGALVCLIQPK